ncbi:MAG TPA: glycosylhydrolase-like jelly roll fold domain-containing protein, partial [Paludibacter sp.]
TLKTLGIKADFTYKSSDSLNFLYYHKQSGDTHVYFVVNQLNKPVIAECSFLQTGKSIQLWEPETGNIKELAIYTESDGYTKVPVNLKARQAIFLVFNSKQKEHITEVVSNNVQLFPTTEKIPGYVPEVVMDNKKYLVNSISNANYEFVTNANKVFQAQIEADVSVMIDNMQVKVEFEKSSIPAIESNKLEWLNLSDYKAVRYFSGIALYTIQFGLPAAFDTLQNYPLVLEFDNFAAACEVVLNGQSLGKAVFQGHQFEISHGLLKQKNTLKVRVANNWRNRIIGNLNEFGNLKDLFTTAPEDQLPSKNMPLTNFGLQGKIIIKNVQGREIKKLSE